MDAAKFLFYKRGKNEYFCRERCISLERENPIINHMLVELNYDAVSFRYRNIRVNAWYDKHNNIILRYTHE